MSSTTTVAEFAAELNKSPATLIEQLTSAGVAKAQASDPLSESDKQKLLGYLHASHGTVAADRKKITLVKKSTRVAGDLFNSAANSATVVVLDIFGFPDWPP